MPHCKCWLNHALLLLVWSSSCRLRAMAEERRDLSFQQMLTRQSPGGLLANFRARRMGLPVPFAAPSPVRADVGYPWRMDWGGHDPATPVAEMFINYHNTAWGIMIFVCTSVFYMMTKR
eukprot:Skav225272  [mRNA]  locus=scaffold4099:137037:138343:+ [translate_table: standard]